MTDAAVVACSQQKPGHDNGHLHGAAIALDRGRLDDVALLVILWSRLWALATLPGRRRPDRRFWRLSWHPGPARMPAPNVKQPQDGCEGMGFI